MRKDHKRPSAGTQRAPFSVLHHKVVTHIYIQLTYVYHVNLYLHPILITECSLDQVLIRKHSWARALRFAQPGQGG